MRKTLFISMVLLIATLANQIAQGMTSNPIISRGKTVYTSSGTAPQLVDNTYGWSAWNVSNNSWIAINLGTGPSKIFFSWNNPSYSWSDVIAAGYSCKQGMSFPVDYLIQKSQNSTNGLDGTWTTVATITGNNVTARGHLVDFSGASWIKMSITTGGGSLDEIEVFDASANGNDSWFFPGTSITANAYKGTSPAQTFADLVALAHPGYSPMMIRGGIPCINSGDLATDISKYLATNANIKYWAIEMGTNDAWGGNNYNAASFKTNMQAVINACKAAGVEPIIARMISTNQTAAGWQVHPDFLKAIDDLTTQNNLIAGPDLYAWFLAHPEDLTSDGVHPSASGGASIQRLWAEKMSTLYTPTIPVPVTGVSISPASVNTAPGTAVQYTVTIAPTNATNKTVSWSSSAPGVATVSSNGLVTAVAIGTTTITVTTADGGFKATSLVTVANVPVTGVSLNTDALSLQIGANSTLTATVVPGDASNKTISWSSSAPLVATVNSTGTVTGVGVGTAMITAATQDGNYTATCTVMVSSAPSCTFGAPLASGLPTFSGSYNKVYVLGSGGPSLNNVNNFTINWNLSLNGLWQLSFNTSNGVPTWWLDLRTVATWKFNQAQPEITFANSGLAGLDGAYWVTMDGNNVALVSKTGGYTIYFSNSATAPACAKSASMMLSDAQVDDKPILLYPNPFSESATLRLANPGNVNCIRITDQLGRTVAIMYKPQIKGEVEIGKDLGKGAYLISIQTSKGIETRSMIKK